MPKSLIGWVVLAIAIVVVWKNPSAVGNFLFSTIPAKINAFFAGV